MDFKPTLLGLLGLPRDKQDEGRDASAFFLTGKAPQDWIDTAFSRNAAGNWLMAVSSRYKFVVYRDAVPSLFDLQQEPLEMKNLFTDPASRETVRSLAQALISYSRDFKEPYADHPAIRADLDWSAEGTGTYVAPQRGNSKRNARSTSAEDSE